MPEIDGDGAGSRSPCTCLRPRNRVGARILATGRRRTERPARGTDDLERETVRMTDGQAGTNGDEGLSPAKLIDARIAELSDWRGALLAQIRELVRQADPDVVEEWKWRGVPTWCHDGILCTGETYERHVKVTFFKGAKLHDPSGVFNAGLGGNARRAIDLHEGDTLDADGFVAVVRAAVALNVG